MQVFYAPGLTGNPSALNENESRHCIQVLRHVAGDIIHLIDGDGGFYKARITEADPHACGIEITEHIPFFHARPCRLQLVIAPPKQTDRFEWLLEKAIEIGIDTITPIRCQRSERKEINERRLEKIVIASMKQAIVAKKPRINSMISFKQLISSDMADYQDRFIAYCDDVKNLPLQEAMIKGRNTIILIGPEGDFTQDEIRMTLASGYKAVSLGNNRLRSETAALVACMIFNIKNS
jgi:16S rRNA (uracil1498-N3)-methyltransferase